MATETEKPQSGERDIKTLRELVSEDWVAVDMARRKVVFHNNEAWDKIDLWGLFDYKDIKKHLVAGKLINHRNYTPENRTYWVIPSKDYWEHSIKPIVERFTEEELQESFRMVNDQ